MRRGPLRHFITIQEDTGTGRDGMNTRIPDWTKWRDAFAEKTAKRGREHFDATSKQRYGETVHLFRCRHVDVEGVTTEMRILFEDQIYNIRAALPDDHGQDDVVIETTLQDGSV